MDAFGAYGGIKISFIFFKQKVLAGGYGWCSCTVQ